MFIARTNVGELIVSIEKVKAGVVDIFIYGMNYIPGRDEYYNLREPGFYLEHSARGVKASFDTILAAVKRGINYHFIWSDDGDDPRSGTIDEFKFWLTELKIENKI